MYVTGNPVRYNDPTGFVKKDEAQRANSIIAELVGYGIWVHQDYGYGPTEEGLKVWQEGGWNLTDIEYFLDEVKQLADRMGGRDNFRYALGRHVSIKRTYEYRSKSPGSFSPMSTSLPNGKRIDVHNNANGDAATIPGVLIHELAHIWDYSNSLKDAMRSAVLNAGEMKEYDYPTEYAWKSRTGNDLEEDFAEAVCVYMGVETGRAAKRPDGLPMSPARINFVSFTFQTLLHPDLAYIPNR